MDDVYENDKPQCLVSERSQRERAACLMLLFLHHFGGGTNIDKEVTAMGPRGGTLRMTDT
jgi:hypothetical protein